MPRNAAHAPSSRINAPSSTIVYSVRSTVSSSVIARCGCRSSSVPFLDDFCDARVQRRFPLLVVIVEAGSVSGPAASGGERFADVLDPVRVAVPARVDAGDVCHLEQAIGMPKSVWTLSICSGLAPASSSSAASVWRWRSMRLPMKPKVTAATTATLLIVLAAPSRWRARRRRYWRRAPLRAASLRWRARRSACGRWSKPRSRRRRDRRCRTRDRAGPAQRRACRKPPSSPAYFRIPPRLRDRTPPARRRRASGERCHRRFGLRGRHAALGSGRLVILADRG
jgi:hypothetical protein